MTPQNSIDRTIDMLERQYNSYYNDIQLLYENNRQLQINIQENARTLINMYDNNNTNINFLYQNLDYLRSLMREFNTLNISASTISTPSTYTPPNPTNTSLSSTSFDPSSSFGFFCSCGIFHNHSLCSTSNEINTPLYTRSTGSVPFVYPLESTNTTQTNTQSTGSVPFVYPLESTNTTQTNTPQTNTLQTNTTQTNTTQTNTPQTNTPQTNTPQTNTTQTNTTQTNTPQTNTTQTNATQTNTPQTNRRSRNISRELPPSRFDFYYFVSNNTNNDITHDEDISDLVDVVVRPTFEQIQNAVRNIQYSSIIDPINESCPISLEPFQQQDNVTQINQCNHIFNTNELNHWFESNVQCPVCRYDIRNYQTPLTNTTSRITRSRSRNRNTHQSSTPIPTPDTIPFIYQPSTPMPTFIPDTNLTTPQTTPIANTPSRRNRHIRYNTDRITSINDINWNDLLYYVAETVIDFSGNNL